MSYVLNKQDIDALNQQTPPSQSQNSNANYVLSKQDIDAANQQTPAQASSQQTSASYDPVAQAMNPFTTTLPEIKQGSSIFGKDIEAGLLNAGQGALQYLHRNVSNIIPETNVNIQEMTGAPTDPINQMYQNIFKYIPAAIAGPAIAGEGLMGQGAAGAVYGAYNDPNHPFWSSVKNALGNVGIGMGAKAIGTVGNALGRLGTAATTSSDAAEVMANQKYNDFMNLQNGDGVNVKDVYVPPKMLRAKLNDYIKSAQAGSPEAINGQDKEDLQSILDNTNIPSSSRANINKVPDLIEQIRNWRRTASTYMSGNPTAELRYRWPNKTMGDVYNNLANTAEQDLTNALNKNGLASAVPKYYDAQNYYRTTKVPFENNPTSVGGVAGQIGAMAAASHLPFVNKLTNFIPFIPKYPIANLGKRFMSPFNGGPQSVLSPGLDSGTQSAIAALLRGNENQP